MKRNTMIATAVIATLLSISIVCNIAIVINISTIQKLKKSEYLYESLKEHYLLERVFSDLENSTVEYNNLEFKHDFVKILSEKETPKSYLMEFEQQKRIVIIEDRLDSNFLYELLSDKAKKNISDYYGEDILKNEFNLIKKALEVTPNDISWFSLSQKKIFANVQLLLIKLQIPLNSNQGDIFTFETRSIQGFQSGTPEQTNNILLLIFNPNGNNENYYTIILNGSFTQNEIDIMLNTMKFTTD